jgi:catechol 2,3-dioxygenase-like lactoylglutathione lyase family enzyme
MNIVGVQALVYGVEDISASIRFFEDWGLTLRERGANGADFTLADGTEIGVRAGGDRSLPAPVVPGSTVREVIWGVDSRASLSAISAELSRDRDLMTGLDRSLHTRDELGYAIGFALSTSRVVPLELPAANTTGRAVRRDRRAAGAIPHDVLQRRMVHVVSWVPRKQHAMYDFYVNRLGFRVTESTKTSGWFLRAARSHDHHNLFLQTCEDNFGFQHAAFEVRDIDDVMMCGRKMEDRGWKTHFGPGRHTTGSNVYWYFENPAGGLAEVGCDMDYITDHWTPLEHETMPYGGSSWYVRREDAELRPGHGTWPQYQELTTVT